MKDVKRLFMLMTVFLFLLSACSNETTETNSDNYTTNPSEDTDDSGQPRYDDHEMALHDYPANWRPGTLLMTLKISQYGDQETETNAQGGTKTNAKWDFILNATHQRQVMLPPDFSRMFPDYEADLIDPMLLDELLFIPLEQAEPITEGEVSFSGFMEVRTPRANEIIMQTTQVTAHTKLEDINLDAVRHSSIGKGFEADLRFAYKMVGNIRTSTRYKGGNIQTFDVECCETEDEYPRFFPEPDMSIAKRVNYPASANMPAAISETNRQLRLDLVEALQRISNNLEPRAMLHPGMQWSLEPNILKLRYHSETANLISQGNLLAMAAPASQRLYTLEISLTAD